MKVPRFSVIITTYNRPNYLVEAIQSVIDQSFEDWELIVIDDGSNPTSEFYVRRFNCSEKIKYRYQNNKGPGPARQHGIDLAQGEYICLLDDDDYYLPNHLQVLNESIQLSGNTSAIYKTGIIELQTTGAKVFSPFFDAKKSPLVQHWQIADNLLPYAIPRHIALLEPSERIFAEDFNWLGRVLLRLPLQQVYTHSVVWRWHGNNRSGTSFNRDALNRRIEAVTALYGHPGMSSHISKSLYKKMVAHQCWHWTRQCVRHERYSAARYGLFRGLGYFTPTSSKDFAYTLYVVCRAVTFRQVRKFISTYINS
ncbi:glycosyltransferase involved in cell wall biosynthesis [Lewinella aquimaris]|uniref:Glycosyltransferase involved in cell wall biosynthesis n=1 Tax=Neolewinella aquimaris TaxID=1835722 RepID=A0A840E1C9_9BACT|nr:glycosyltransferase [Neolewinella aquimaris]MBB4077525.1 glycosyltransferase involved in cell wall biosynthesis [Neolewinella aquimaris]